MLGYGYNITIDDRWRIVMYIRALQRSQNAAARRCLAGRAGRSSRRPRPSLPAPAPGTRRARGTGTDRPNSARSQAARHEPSIGDLAKLGNYALLISR